MNRLRALVFVSCTALACGRSELETADIATTPAPSNTSLDGAGGSATTGGATGSGATGGAATGSAATGGAAAHGGETASGGRACTWGFAPPVNYPGGEAPSTVVVADLDDDGYADIAVNNYGGGQDGLRLQILRNQGDGTFVSGTSFQSTVAFSMASGRFVSSKNDLLVGCDLFQNLGNGDFGAATTYGSDCGFQDSWRNLATADFDADGRLDFAWGLSDTVYSYLNRGNGVFTEIFTPFLQQPAHVTALTSADFDRDGVPDLAAASWGYGYPNSITVFHGRGDGLFDTNTSDMGNVVPNSIAAGDVDGDGRADIVTTTAGLPGLELLLQKPDGKFSSPLSFPAALSSPITLLGDINGDGAVDIVVAQEDTAEVSYFLNDGDGTFGSQMSLMASGVVWNAALGDVNGDGHLDVVAAISFSNPGGYAEVWLSQCR